MTAAASRGAVGRGGALIAVPIQKHKEPGYAPTQPRFASPRFRPRQHKGQHKGVQAGTVAHASNATQPTSINKARMPAGRPAWAYSPWTRSVVMAPSITALPRAAPNRRAGAAIKRTHAASSIAPVTKWNQAGSPQRW